MNLLQLRLGPRAYRGGGGGGGGGGGDGTGGGSGSDAGGTGAPGTGSGSGVGTGPGGDEGGSAPPGTGAPPGNPSEGQDTASTIGTADAISSIAADSPSMNNGMGVVGMIADQLGLSLSQTQGMIANFGMNAVVGMVAGLPGVVGLGIANGAINGNPGQAIGSVVGAATGIPGMGSIGSAIGNATGISGVGVPAGSVPGDPSGGGGAYQNDSNAAAGLGIAGGLGSGGGVAASAQGSTGSASGPASSVGVGSGNLIGHVGESYNNASTQSMYAPIAKEQSAKNFVDYLRDNPKLLGGLQM